MRDVRAGPKDYMQRGKRCAELANECSAPTVAEALRALALDYLARAANCEVRPNHLDKDAIERVGPIGLRVSARTSD